ncbi:MAG: ketoacyl-ACP synthase III [Thermodesulfobacteriota bacterium]
MTIGIEDIAYHLPEQSISSRELAARFGFSLPFLEEKLGVRSIFVAAPGEYSSDLAVMAVRSILQRRPEVLDRLGVLVVCTQTPDYQLPHTAALVQVKLGLPAKVACFDLGLGCSGYVYGLSVVKAFMESNGIEAGLLVTAETYSKIIADDDRNTKPLFSDAAAATLLGHAPRLTVGRFTFGTSGAGADSLIVRRTDQYLGPRQHLHMDGRRVFELVAAVVPEDIRRCAAVNGMTLAGMDRFVFHQASLFMLQAIAKRLDVEGHKVFSCVERFGNTVSSSVPIALHTLLVQTGGEDICHILISGFGVGLSWASTVLENCGGGWHV